MSLFARPNSTPSQLNQISQFRNARMSIGILFTAFLVLTMPEKCTIESKEVEVFDRSFHYLTTRRFDAKVNATKESFELSNTTIFEATSWATTFQPPWTATLNSFDKRSRSERYPPENNGKLAKRNWPVKHSAEMNGDLILGGLMMVHEREDSITCGPVMPQGGIQALETMLYTLDVINSIGILPNITMGAHILDDCDKDTYGLEMAVDFIKGYTENGPVEGATEPITNTDLGNEPCERN